MSLFLEPAIAKQYECAICFEIYKEPVQVGCEEHVFCHQCVKDLISEKGRSFDCPLCRTKCHSKSITRVKFVDRQINDLKIQCPNAIEMENNTNNNQSTLRRSTRLKAKTENKESSGQKRKRSYDDGNTNIKKRKLNDDPFNGCEWKGCYSELAQHRTTCPLQIVRCQFCDLAMFQRNLSEHHIECPLFPMQCVECEKTGILREHMAAHIVHVCPMRWIRCTECKEDVQRKNIKFHDENECSEAVIECVFRRFGCMEKLKRKDEKKHVLSAAFTHNHLMQVAKKQAKLEHTVNALEKENDGLTARIIALEKEHVKTKWDIGKMKQNMVRNKTTISKLPRHFSNAKLVYVTNDEGKFVTYDKENNEYSFSDNYTKRFHR